MYTCIFLSNIDTLSQLDVYQSQNILLKAEAINKVSKIYQTDAYKDGDKICLNTSCCI